ncbi:ABC transporter permease [Kineococcus gypseus]|uniref:ABC transporter permease n=1 Tax=Kineococcus gypseus TaxID=1637102 RepID=UPI003D7F0B4E
MSASTRAGASTGAGSTVRPTGSRAGLYALAAATEVRAGLRSPELAVLGVALPAVLYAVFGLPNAGRTMPGGTGAGLVVLAGIGCYGALTLGVAVVGEEVAEDRGRGWLRTLAATPVPTSAYLVGKLGGALVHALLMVLGLCALAAAVGGVRLEPARWAALGALLVAGVLVCSPLGVAIAFLVRPRVAVVITNLVFLPLSFASGFFVPLSELPAVLRDVAPWLPTHHFGQLVLLAVADERDVAALSGLAPQHPAVHAAWVLGAAVLAAALALAGAHREAVTRRG